MVPRNNFTGCWRVFQKIKVTDWGVSETVDSIPSFDSRSDVGDTSDENTIKVHPAADGHLVL